MNGANIGLIEFEGLIVNYSEQTVYYESQEIIMTNREFQTLHFLLSHRGQVFSKGQIYRSVTELDEKEELQTVEITISRIRKKLEQVTGRSDYL